MLMISLIVSLCVILNPVTTASTYVSMHQHTSHKQLIHDCLVIAFGVCIVLCITSLVGQEILELFGLDIAYFRIAGGCVIGWVAWSLAQGNTGAITPSHSSLQQHKTRTLDRGLIVPLVLPMTSGPGTIAYIISQTDHYSLGYLLIASISASVVVYIVMRYGTLIMEKLGDTGISIMTRIMGVILLGISLQMIIGTIIILTTK